MKKLYLLHPDRKRVGPTRPPPGQDLAAALKARLRHVELKQCRARRRLMGYNAAHFFTGPCPCPRRHRNLYQKIALRARFIRDLQATRDAVRCSA